MYFDTKHINAVDLVSDAFRDDLVILSGVLAERCAPFYYRPSDSRPITEQANL
jgi:tRNA(adenine34) deaminase